MRGWRVLRGWRAAAAVAGTAAVAAASGMVLANPSSSPQRIDLREAGIGGRLVRLQGSPEQDPEVNDGGAVGDVVTLPARDALFLQRR